MDSYLVRTFVLGVGSSFMGDLPMVVHNPTKVVFKGYINLFHSSLATTPKAQHTQCILGNATEFKVPLLRYLHDYLELRSIKWWFMVSSWCSTITHGSTISDNFLVTAQLVASLSCLRIHGLWLS